MRIDGGLPNFYLNYPQTGNRVLTPASNVPQNNSIYYGPGVVVEISQQARDAYRNSIAAPAASGETSEVGEIMGMEGCQTCKSRRYVDQSSDSSVSFQTPTHISPEQSASKVMAHEREHIANDKAKAEQEDRRVVSQTVSLTTSVCSECGKMYVSGGSARTVTASKNDAGPQAENNNNTGTGDTNA
jgi:hypothetical protein